MASSVAVYCGVRSRMSHSGRGVLHVRRGCGATSKTRTVTTGNLIILLRSSYYNPRRVSSRTGKRDSTLALRTAYRAALRYALRFMCNAWQQPSPKPSEGLLLLHTGRRAVVHGGVVWLCWRVFISALERTGSVGHEPDSESA